ncbi:MAG TPA: tetratricopeptide repeat protein [Pyrinomonadaceae bacterium]|nr:tetratricopeptide repeat protein [Pyrinomonadaceae bacterium]
MTGPKFPRRTLVCLCVLAFACVPNVLAQSDSIHEVEVYLRARSASVNGVNVRLIRQSGMMPVANTFSNQDGRIKFTGLLPGEYVVETSESDKFEATATRVTVRPIEFTEPKPTSVSVYIDLPARKGPEQAAPGVVLADVDLKVPDAALKRYRKGMEALRAGNRDDATEEFKAAVNAYPQYYAARLELGRQLRAQLLFDEAEAALRPLGEIAPKRAEPRIEYAIVLLALKRPKEAAGQLRKALELEETNWVTHLHLGWALLETEPAEAERYFRRALELDERKAAQAHLSLARLAYAKGQRQDSIRHLEAYLTLAPDAPDAPAVRQLARQLRRSDK